jgi:predicted HTH domain antitoxin
MMELAGPIDQADLARDPRRVMDAVRNGTPTVVRAGSGGDVALVDLIDFRILRAVARAQTDPMATDGESLPDSNAANAVETQERFDLVVAYYLAEQISLGRVAELFGLSWADLRDRFVRLGVPLRQGPTTTAELAEEVRAARGIGDVVRRG